MKPATRNQFISKIKGVGLPLATNFFVFIPRLGGEDLMMMCESVNLPGLNIMTSDNKIYGESTEMPHGSFYSQVSMTFILDNSMALKRAFDDWFAQVFNRDLRSVGYYDNYVRNINIFTTDRNGKVIYCQQLNRCFPKTLGDVQMSYDAANQVLRMNVTFAYKFWTPMLVLAGGDIAAKVTSINQAMSDPSGLVNQYLTSNQTFQSKFETQNILTGVTPTGIIPQLNQGNLFDFSGGFLEKMGSYGSSVGPSFGSAGAQVNAAVNSTNMDNTFSSSITSGMNMLTRDMTGYGGGLVELSKDIVNYVGPISNISKSVAGISQTMGVINGAFNSIGLGSPFGKVVTDLNKAAGTIGKVAGLAGIPGQISNIGAILTSTGGIFNQTAGSIIRTPGYTDQVGTSMTNMGSKFFTEGSNSQNLAATMAAKITSGDIP